MAISIIMGARQATGAAIPITDIADIAGSLRALIISGFKPDSRPRSPFGMTLFAVTWNYIRCLPD